ncbi:hypothetical protein HDU78_003900 [Chytriomyces hyalinus]|nr:hypothetical protein HDU78_003900 [Chytriomyces hyalinus]
MSLTDCDVLRAIPNMTAIIGNSACCNFTDVVTGRSSLDIRCGDNETVKGFSYIAEGREFVLSGDLAVFGRLRSLEALTLHSNDFSGILPDMSTWNSLTAIDLRKMNRITGGIPKLPPNLNHLYLHRLSLSGSIPTAYPASITGIHIENCGITGDIPSELAALTMLPSLSIRRNSLSGSIPTEIGLLTRLSSLELDGNGLTGPIPTELGNLKNLTVRCNLSNNLLTGPIPPGLRTKAPGGLFVGNNLLDGDIPQDLAAEPESNLELNCFNGQKRRNPKCPATVAGKDLTIFWVAAVCVACVLCLIFGVFQFRAKRNRQVEYLDDRLKSSPNTMEEQAPTPKSETTPIIHTIDAESVIEILWPASVAKPSKESDAKSPVDDHHSMLNAFIVPHGEGPIQRPTEAIDISKASKKAKLAFELVDPRVWSVDEIARWAGTIVGEEDRARVYQAVIEESITGEIFRQMTRVEMCGKLGLAWGDAVKLQDAFNAHLNRFFGDQQLPPPEYQEMA